MISKQEILDRAQEWQLRPNVVEKDYVIGWLLWGIANTKALKDTWAFKGGTCLKKCFIETYRFSEDLDFSVLPGGPISAEEVEAPIKEVLQTVSQASGLDFSFQNPKLKNRPQPGNTEGRVYYRGPLQTPTPASVKIDLTSAEMVVRPSVLRATTHPYTDSFPEGTNHMVRCYGLEEVFAEKIRALGERTRPRDLYDVVNLYRRQDLQLAPALISDILLQKCQTKGVTVPTYAAIVQSPLRAELEGEWGNMLAHQLPVLPPIEQFLDEIEAVFKWLSGDLTPTQLPSAGSASEDVDTSWSPPPTVWAWGQGVPLESVRFAGANRLCIDLTYNGSVRRIEPYSLRRTRAGNLLLFAIKLSAGQIRAYRVDRIQGIQVTTQPFTPRFAVEFAPAGIVASPPLQSLNISRGPRTSTGIRPLRRTRTSYFDEGYRIQCPYCDRIFRRTKRNLTLGTHKDQYGDRCSGSGRRGYEI